MASIAVTTKNITKTPIILEITKMCIMTSIVWSAKPMARAGIIELAKIIANY